MKINKKILLILLLSIFSIVSLFANYRISDYKIKVEVSEDYVLKVKEDYVFNYDTPRHGFYRVIPYQNYENHSIKIKNIKVDGGSYQTEKSAGLLTIRVGDPDITVTGEVPYSISYTFDIGADTYPDFDEFYFNLVGSLWECPIDKASFEITFPKPINKDMVWLTRGKSGSTNVDNSFLNFSSDNKIISGTLSNLNEKEGVTIRAELEDGYFIGARDYRARTKVMLVFFILINLVLIVLSYLIFNKYGRDDKIIEKSRFEAPEGFTPLSLDYFMHNYFSSSAYSASFIYWAQQGYISIKQNEDESIRLIRKVDFVKVKKDKNNNLDYRLFNAIFRGSEIGEEVDLEKLDSEDIGSSLAKLTKAGERQFDSRLLHDSKSSKMRIFIFLFAMLSAATGVLFTFVSTGTFMPLGLVGSFFFIVLSLILLSPLNSKWALFKLPRKIITILAVLLLTLVFAFVNFINLYLTYLVDDQINLIVSVFSALSMLIIVVLFSLTEKRSQFAQNALEELLGYTSFLKLVEVDQIEKMIEENPEFYFKHLGFAQVLNLTKVWEKKFAKINIVQPSWYICSTYGLYTYSRINNVSTSLSKALDVPLAEYAKAHASSSGSSSSGFSGSVGGGAGGGGGGAW